MSKKQTIENLLFGLFAFQMDKIQRASLIKAIQKWTTNKNQSLGEILVENKDLSATDHEMLEQMVQRNIEVHNGDPQQSFSTLTIIDSLRADLESIEDPELQESLNAISSFTSSSLNEPTVAYYTPSKKTSSHSSLGMRFSIIRPHAEGGLGKVSIAIDKELNRQVAIKEIKDNYAQDLMARTRFNLEAEITGGLEHPGVVPVYGLGHRDDGQPFYAMRFIKGDSLKEACATYHAGKTTRSESENVLLFRQLLGRFVDVCNTIEYAHSRGVLHRDLKPGNIMLGKYGETLVVDWGLAKSIAKEKLNQSPDERTLQPVSGDSTTATMMGSVVGTPQFMSPEQAGGRLEELGPASDVYSLGATLYYLLVNQPPFANQPTHQILENVSKGIFTKPCQADKSIPRPLEAICLKAMALKPTDRYASPEELAKDIERYLADEPTTAYRESSIAKILRLMQRFSLPMAGGFLFYTSFAYCVICLVATPYTLVANKSEISLWEILILSSISLGYMLIFGGIGFRLGFLVLKGKVVALWIVECLYLLMIWVCLGSLWQRALTTNDGFFNEDRLFVALIFVITFLVGFALTTFAILSRGKSVRI
jgi:serine/threonine protein kinase